MAAFEMTPKLLGRISNEKYQEKDKWRIDDIALGLSNELLISGHNLEIPQTFISMHKEDSGKYDNFPEFNQNFDRTQPCEQLVLFLKGSSIIGLKVESALRLVSIGDMCVLRTLWLEQSPTCICFYKGNIYASSSSSAIVSVCNLDSEEKNGIVLSDMGSDCVLDIVVVMEKIYVCTKVAGRALVFSMTGSKKMEFKNAIRTDAKAKSICIHERTELVFVSWNNCQIQLYSQKTSWCLRAFDMTEKLHKIRVTTEHILVTLSASKCIVSVYDLGEAIKFGESQNTILSSVKKKDQKKLISRDVENLEIHPAEFETFSFSRKSASKQSKVEKLRDRKALDMKQLEENENLARQYNREIQKAKTESNYLRRKNEENEEKCCDLTKQLEAERKATEEAKTESNDLRRKNEENEEICRSLTKQLEAERKATEEGGITKDTVAVSTENMKTDLRGLIDGILDDTMEFTKQKNDVTEELEITKSTLTKKEEDRSQIQVELDTAISNKMDLEKTMTKSEELYRIIQAKEREIQQLRMRLKKAQTEVENAKTQVTILQERKQELEKSLSSEQERSKDLEKLFLIANHACSGDYDKTTAQLEDAVNRLNIEYERAAKNQTFLSDLNERVKELEFTRNELESHQKKLKDNLDQETRKVSREGRSRIQMVANLKKVEESNKKLENALTQLKERLLAEGMAAEKLQTASLKILETQEDEKRIPRDENILAVMRSIKGKINRLGEGLSKSKVTLAPSPSDSFKFGESQRHDRYPYWFNDAEAAVSELMDSGVITSHLERDECCSGLFAENVDQVSQELKVAVTVSIKGTKMLIPDTGVELNIPEGSILSRQLIEINIIDFDSDKFDTLFSLYRNSSVAVQLLPNKAILRWPARLRLPHCLRLKANFQEVKSHVKIYRSDHALGQEAQWEHDPELRYELKEDCCIIFVKKLCSFTYDVTEEAIDATNVTVFTAGKKHGTSMELAVGYHLDLPGRREMLLAKKSGMKIFNAKPFEFVKDSTDTLQVHLTTAVSRAHNDEETTEVVGKFSVSEAAAKIAELPLDRPKSLYSRDTPGLEGNLHISTAILKVSETVSNKGTTMRILDTGIELTIPPYAVKGYQYIEMSVIPFGTLDAPISTFSSNSSVTVELLPNGATFSTPVRLSLPHCLKLKKGFSKRSVKVYLSHHEKDQKPSWEELPDAKYELKADHCVIYLTSFCWVKYEIDNKIVVAKRIKVYTATRGMEQNDQIAEVEVGYFIDMPGRAENLRENVDLKISQCKPLLFFKEGNLPLQIFLIKVLPMFWKYSTPERNPKVIPYKNIADSLDTSLPFVFEKQDANEQKPFAMFRVSQGNEEVEINIRL